eukprot:TRINITY_DN26662_c0_g1_i3.p1 TRINITY_DN26662_c0_g1~~TRINITY_DN26662_c0_g1_i3.p1  ORF type:complete len:424 (-),score=38.31 TRINITY_DN26662_c0_g1_i3:293-1564(-)
MAEPSIDVDKLSYEIFSILEANFLFGYDTPKLNSPSTPSGTLKPSVGKVRILSIDSAGSTDGLLAAKSLSLLESSLRRRSADPDARIADFFDVSAGSGVGGILAALLFTRGEDGRPLFTAGDAMRFLLENRRRISSPSVNGRFRRIFRLRESRAERLYRKTFSECTLKDTLKPLLVPCYDVLTGAPFLFSRADALETDGYDFKMRDVCLATCADATAVEAVEMRSVDGKTKIAAVDGGVATSNPTAAAITHVLNNKQEFPFCRGVEDLLVVSLGNGESDSGGFAHRNMTPGPGDFVRIAGAGVSDMVDQAVSMAFGESRKSNYIRIQANGFNSGRRSPMVPKSSNASEAQRLVAVAEEMLTERNVESILFRGKKMAERTNADKLDSFAAELIKEKERRKLCVFPTVLLKQATPRTSSATMSSC